MGVDFYPCKSCEEVFCDCGDYVWCAQCGSKWCSDDCASDDWYEKANCSLGICISEEGCLENYNEECPKYCSSDDIYYDCDGCENYVETSCKYCRKADYEDSELLNYALNMLDISRNDFIAAINEGKGE